MAPASPEEQPPADLVAELERRVALRRERGDVPASLEHDLDDHFRRILAHRPRPVDVGGLHRGMADVDRATGFSPARIDVGVSGMPGGAAMHRAVARLVSRQTDGILAQSQQFAEAVRDVLHGVVGAVEQLDGHVRGDLTGRIDALYDELFGGSRAEPLLDVAVQFASVGGTPTLLVAAAESTLAAQLAERLDHSSMVDPAMVPDALAEGPEAVALIDVHKRLAADEVLALLEAIGSAESVRSVVMVTSHPRAAVPSDYAVALLRRSGFPSVQAAAAGRGHVVHAGR